MVGTIGPVVNGMHASEHRWEVLTCYAVGTIIGAGILGALDVALVVAIGRFLHGMWVSVWPVSAGLLLTLHIGLCWREMRRVHARSSTANRRR